MRNVTRFLFILTLAINCFACVFAYRCRLMTDEMATYVTEACRQRDAAIDELLRVSAERDALREMLDWKTKTKKDN